MKKKFTQKHLNILEKIGLTPNQSLLYLTSLQKGILSALELSRLTKINRHQVYSDASKLIELGLYEQTSKKQKKYIPAHPSQLEKIQQQKIHRDQEHLSDIQILLPDFTALTSSQKSKPKITYFEGHDQIMKGYSKELDVASKKEVLTFVGSIENTFSFLSEKYWDRWNKKFVKQGSSSKMLVDASEYSENITAHDSSYNRETRFISNFPIHANIDVFYNTTYIVSFHDEIGIWIESNIIADTYRTLFKVLWKQAKE